MSTQELHGALDNKKGLTVETNASRFKDINNSEGEEPHGVSGKNKSHGVMTPGMKRTSTHGRNSKKSGTKSKHSIKSLLE